jgi:uncharacterized membrane protein YcjF (UPF0283 family)
MRYRLRTLLIILALAPPFLAGVFHYRNWRALQSMRSLERATWKREEVLEVWRKTYDRFHAGEASATEEAAIRQEWYAAWHDVENAKQAIKARYGSLDAARQRAAQAQQFER